MMNLGFLCRLKFFYIIIFVFLYISDSAVPAFGESLDTVTLQLKWAHQFQFAGYYAAIEKGYYADAGLQVKLKVNKPGLSCTDEVMLGHADYGIDMPIMLLERQKGKDIVVLAAILQHSPEILLTLKDSGINTPHDLIGKTVMLRPKGNIELRAMLLNEGIRLDQIRIIDHTWDINDLIDGKVDALAGYITDRPFILHKRGVQYSMIQPLTYGIDFYGDCLFTTEKEINEHPKRVEAFLQASIKGWQYAMKHQEEIIDLIIEKYKTTLQKDALLYEAKVMQELMQPEFIEIGHMNSGRWQHIVDTFEKLGMLKPGFSLKGFLYEPNLQADYTKLMRTVWILLSVAAGIIIYAIFLFVYSRKLNREVHDRTKHLSDQIAISKRVEKELKVSEEKYRQLFENANEGIVVIQDNLFKFFNPKIQIISGCNSEELNKMIFSDIIHQDDRQKVSCLWGGNGEIQDVQDINDFKIIDKEDNERWLESNCVRIKWDNKPAVLIFLSDITKRKIFKKQRLEEKLFSDAVINSLPGIFYVYEDGQRLIRWNKNFEKESGFTGAEMLNRHPLDWFRGEEKEKIREKLKTIFVKGVDTVEGKMVFARGEVAYYLTGTILIIANRTFLIGVGFDISHKKRLEEELNQAQKMEAIGTLAGGIAHDFNNILAAIYGYAQLAELDQGLPPKVKDHIGEILKASDRAKELVKQILTFSRKAEHEKQPIQIALIIKEALKLLRSSIPTTIEIQQEIISDAVVWADPTKIHQITMNLCTNAYHAMRDTGGILSVSLKEVCFGQNDIVPQSEISPGSYVKLEVADNGCGMDSETRSKIFEPYFTTKEAEEGTGLGLAVVRGIVKDHNGCINVYSEKNQGTSFHVYFPIIKQKAVAYSKKAEKGMRSRGGERIVVIDDEEQLINFTEKILSKYGYKVTTFTDGVQALQVIKNQPDRFDLIITDLSMPHMNGIEVAKEILAVNPQLPIILNTGLSEVLSKKEALAAGIKEYCEKPLDVNTLLRTIRKLLDTTTANKSENYRE